MVGARAQPQVDTRHLPTAAKEVLRRADVHHRQRCAARRHRARHLHGLHAQAVL